MRRRLNRGLLELRRRIGFLPGFCRPTHLLIEPTNCCDLACPLCPTGNGTLRAPRGMMAWELFTAIAEELAPYLVEANLWGYGEPFLHPGIHEMIAYFSERGVRTRVSSNGGVLAKPDSAERLIESGLDVLKISMDGITPETHARYRVNADLEALIAGLERLRALQRATGNRRPRVVIQFMVMSHNEAEIPKARDLAARLEVGLRLKAVGVDRGHFSEWLPRDGLTRYADRDAGRRPLRRQPRCCPFPWRWAVISWDGEVLPCCKDPHREHRIGRLGPGTSFRELWHSERFDAFRAQLRRDRSLLTRCRECVLPSSRDYRR